MKTEKEIRERLERMYALRSNDSYYYDYQYKDMLEHKIKMLEWVLNDT